MIRTRLLFFGFLLSAFAWQSTTAMLGGQSPWVVGTLFLGGALALFFSTKAEGVRWPLLIGTLLTMGLATPALRGLLARWREAPGLDQVFAGLANLFGMQAAASDGVVTYHSGDMAMAYMPSFDRMAAFPLLAVLIAFGALLLLVPIKDAGRQFARMALTLAAYGLVRLFVIFLLRLEIPEQGFETGLMVQILTLAPLALLAPHRLELAETTLPNTIMPRLMVAGAAGLLWALSAGFVDPGIAKPGRVLFEDAHGQWEPTDTPFDTQSYKQKYSYSYSSFFKLLQWHYDARAHREGPITAESLKDTDVLIIKTPTQAFTVDEIETIRQWVADGGGLFLIGDHTNLFGMTTYINQVARPYHLAFRPDDTFSMITEAQSYWRAPKLAPHPIAEMTRDFEFETSCTIDAPLTARGTLIGYGLGSELADYSRPGFFGNLHLDHRDNFGFFLQGATTYYGKGRVAAIADSTPFSNFSVFFPGRRELLLGSISWLNRSNTALKHLPLLSFGGFMLCLIFLATWTQPAMAGRTLMALSLGASLGFGVSNLATDQYELPAPHQETPKLIFDKMISAPNLPSVLLEDDQMEHTAMDTFFVAGQRLGYLPIASDDWDFNLDQALDDRRTIVMMHPQGTLNNSQREDLVRFVSAGGNLLVIDGLVDRGAATNDVLHHFGMGVEVRRTQSSALLAHRHLSEEPQGHDDHEGHDHEGHDHECDDHEDDAELEEPLSPYLTARPLLAATGGHPILQDAEGNALFAMRGFGKGRVGVVTDSLMFSKGALGSRFVGEPDESQKQAHHTAYTVLQQVMEGRPWRPDAIADRSE